jgi:phage-related holin
MKYIEACLIAILAIFAPVKASLIAAFALVVLDFITGVWAAKKRGEPITSTGFKRSVGKIALYEIAICLAFICQQYLTGSLFPACKVVTTMVGLVELKSCLENLDEISGTDIFSAILSKITQAEKND